MVSLVLKPGNAVKIFQRRFGINADGIVGKNTWESLLPYINGYTYYTIKSGDTVYSVARNFKINVAALINKTMNSKNQKSSFSSSSSFCYSMRI